MWQKTASYLQPKVRAANKLPTCTDGASGFPRMLDGHRMDVPLLIATHVEQTVAQTVKKSEVLPFMATASASLVFGHIRIPNRPNSHF